MHHTEPNDALLDMWLATRAKTEHGTAGPLSSQVVLETHRRHHRNRSKDMGKGHALKDELRTNYFPRMNRDSPRGPRSASSCINETNNSSLPPPSKRGKAEHTIFYNTKSSGNGTVLEDRDVVDILSLLCLDTPVDRIEVPQEECATFVPIRRCTEKDFSSIWDGVDDIDGPQGIDDAYKMMMDPNRCIWSNAEWVCAWILLITSQPLKLLHFFADIDEICMFFCKLQKRGAALFVTSIHTEHIHGFNISMLLHGLHGLVLSEFEEYVCATFTTHKEFYKTTVPQTIATDRRKSGSSNGNSSSSTGGSDGLDVFLTENMLVSMYPPFDHNTYVKILPKLGIVPFPQRMPYKMDLWDIEMSLICITKAWKSWNFWYGGTFVYNEATEAYTFVNKPLVLSTQSVVTTRSCCDRSYLVHLRGLMEYVDVYLGWLRFRFTEICAHGTMDMKNARIKEHTFLISGLMSVIQTFVNTYTILYDASDERMMGTTYTLSHFIEDVYTTEKDISVMKDTLILPGHTFKVLDDTEAALVSSSMADVPGICEDLVKETLTIAAYGVICDDIITKVERALHPIHSNIIYHSRAGGYGTNTRVAMKETSPRSSFVNQQEVMDIIAGSMSKIEDGLTPDTRWIVDYALQLQAIDTSMSQIVSTFSWSQKYLVDDSHLLAILKDMRAWPSIGEDGKNLDDTEHEPDPSKSLIKFRDGEGGYRSIVVIRLGCTFIVHGYGHTFCTPSLMEAYHAWVVLKDAYEGWTAYYYTSYIAEDKSQQQKMVICDLEDAVKYILYRRFSNAATFQDNMDEKVLTRISKRVDASRRGGKKGLTGDDIEGTQK